MKTKDGMYYEIKWKVADVDDDGRFYIFDDNGKYVAYNPIIASMYSLFRQKRASNSVQNMLEWSLKSMKEIRYVYEIFTKAETIYF